MCCYKSRLVFNRCFYDTDISQGSAATCLRCGGIFSDSIITYVFPDSDGEIIVKIGQYSMKVRRTKMCAIYGPPCAYSDTGQQNAQSKHRENLLAWHSVMVIHLTVKTSVDLKLIVRLALPMR